MPQVLSSKVSPYSSIAYRQKAAALMEQIKTDVKRQKRVLSGDWDNTSHTTHVEDHSLTGSIKTGASGKENHRHRRTSSSKSNVSRSRSSPKKSSKLTSEDKDLLKDFSHMSINLPAPIVNITFMPPTVPPITQATAPSTLAPPSYPSTSIRLATNEDLNRFVSSSTASGTTLTSGSAPSFLKHAGPAHIRTIAPGDLPSLPERFGDMLFDKVMMKWIKSTAKSTMDEKSLNNSVEVSDDPFGDIESLQDDSKTGGEIEQSARLEDVDQGGLREMSIIEEQSEADDGEEMELTSFSTDASAHVVNIMTGVDTDGYDDDLTTDSEDADDLHTATQGEINDIDFDSEYEDAPLRDNSPAIESSDLGSHLAPPPPPAKSVGTPNRGNFGSLNETPVIKSALKSNSLTPTSALKNSRRYQTPVSRKGHHRSVSFSDGKRDGPIRGLLLFLVLLWKLFTQFYHPRYWYLEWTIGQIEANRRYDGRVGKLGFVPLTCSNLLCSI